MQDNTYLARMTGNRFVNTIINDFLREVIRSSGVGVHARTFFDRIESRQNFDRCGIVLIIQNVVLPVGSSCWLLH